MQSRRWFRRQTSRKRALRTSPTLGRDHTCVTAAY
jgi:hypothetical protein